MISRVMVFVSALLCLSKLSFGVELRLGGGIAYTPMTSKIVVSDPGLEGTASDHFNFGTVCAFFDLPFLHTTLSYASRFSGSFDSAGSFTGTGIYTNRETFLGIGILLRYPFTVGRFSVFPLIGVENDINLTYADADGNDLKSGLSSYARDHLNKAFLKVGVGADILVSKFIFLRPTVLLGFRLISGIQRDTVEYYKSTYALTDVMASTSEFEIALLVGFRPKEPKDAKSR
jgi:hypothetical protein